MSRSVSTLKRTKKKQKTPDKMPKCEQESDVDILTDEYESDIEFQNIIPFSDSSSSDCSDTDIDEEQGVPLKWTKLLKHHGNVEFTGPPSGATEDYSDRQRKLKNDPYWSDAKYKVITEEDIKAYFGIRILMGINKLPQLLDYWSTNPSMRNERIASTMSRQKFLTIQRYFHINDPTQDPTRLKDHDVAKKKLERDPLFKVSPLMEAMRENSMTKYNMHQNISVDEAMIKCHGQHSSIVGAPNKPAKRGFKIFVCADAVSGYLWNFQVYLR
ncbi:piggyBac transposable element-derived protein 4-like [Mya arenaria]|uniref:piggyBac transposable element-derived protein 4-like n=1 Tax=Mya arenaria TaxID=6604 RepID=UPI0022E3D127|nr:piggyBac transposable element-derived protein 4-like [Mya arenaria]